jgi:D-ribose pyranase
MKKGALLNADLSQLIASLGHGDMIVIGDAGLPVPPGVRCIDLAVTRNVPRLLEVLDAVLAEMHVEKSWIAEELATGNPEMARALGKRLSGAQTSVTEPHEALKLRTKHARAVVRTGEFTRYANIVLSSGVVFGD